MLPELLPQFLVFGTRHQADIFPLLLQVLHIIADFMTLLAGKQPLSALDERSFLFDVAGIFGIQTTLQIRRERIELFLQSLACRAVHWRVLTPFLFGLP